MTQKYQVKVSMKQAAIVETGIVLKQGDFGMQIEIEVLDFDATGTTPQIVFRKAMGAVESTTITVSGNKYTYTFKGTELDTPGKCFCDLKLKNSTTQRISTASFMFKVVADTLDGIAEESSSYSDTIAQIVGTWENYTTAITPALYIQYLSGVGIENKLPFYAKAGDNVTIEAVSGTFTVQKIFLLDINGDEIAWYNLNPYFDSPRTIVIADGSADVYFVYVTGTAQDIKVTNNSSIYNDKAQIAKNTDLTDTLKGEMDTVVSANMIGLKANELYPINYGLKVGKKWTVSTSDGSTFPSNTQIQFVDASGTQIGYYMAQNTSRTFEIIDQLITAKYIRINKDIGVPVMLNVGDTAQPYTPYLPPLSQTTKKTDDIIPALYIQFLTDVGQQNMKVFYAKGGDSVTIETVSGSNFTVSKIHLVDKIGQYISWYGLSDYGNKRTVTLPNNVTDIYFVYVEGTAQDIKVTNNSSVFNDKVQIAKDAVNVERLLKTIPLSYKTEISAPNILIPFFIEQGDIFTICTKDGSKFAGTPSDSLKFYDINGNYVTFNGIGSEQGRYRTLTYSNATKSYYVLVTYDQPYIITNHTKAHYMAYEFKNRDIVGKYINDKTKNDRESLKKNSDNRFIFFSDCHLSWDNVERIFDYANATDGLNAVINGGDNVYLMNQNISKYNTLVGNCNKDVLFAIGNHDLWSETWVTGNPVDVYTKFIAPVISNVSDIVQPSGASTDGLCYYYKDYGDIRVIVLVAMDYSESEHFFWDQNQLTWFEGVLADAITNNKTVLCVNHSPYSKSRAVMDKNLPINTFIDYNTYRYDGIFLADEAISAVDTFIENGGEFIGWLTGHNHADYIMYESSNRKQTMINIATASRELHFDGFSPSAAELESDNFDCFDYIGIDTTNKIVKVLRIGFNEDASMRIRNRFAYRYSDNVVLSYS